MENIFVVIRQHVKYFVSFSFSLNSGHLGFINNTKNKIDLKSLKYVSHYTIVLISVISLS